MPTVLRAKCVIVGDSGVGKSAITQVFHSDNSQFPKNYTMTVGTELCTKTVTVPETHTLVELFLLDSAGKEIFLDICRKEWDQPSLVVVVYDVTSQDSFNSCEQWLERVRLESGSKQASKISGVLVANKIDLDERRVISPKDGEHFAQSKGLAYFECSAKEMQYVDQPFLFLAKAFYKLYQSKLEIFKSLG